MAIRTIYCHRVFNEANYINPKYKREDGSAIPTYECGYPKDYYIHPDVYEPNRLILEGKPVPPGYVLEKDETAHVGRVVLLTTQIEQIMSDVWGYVTRAVLYSPETKGTASKYGSVQETDYIERFYVGGEEDAHMAIAEVDAPAEVIASYHAMVKEREETRARQEREYRAKQERETIAPGKIVRVNRGRKVPIGTQGLCFYMKQGAYGTTLGVARTPKTEKRPGKYGNRQFDSYTDVVWVAESNCDVVNSESNEGMAQALQAWKDLPVT